MRFRSGPAAAVLLTAAMAFVVIDALQMDAGNVRDARYATVVLDDRVVQLSQQRAEAGDVIEAWPERLLGGPFGHYDLLIVDGGQGRAFLNGSQADTIHYEVRGIDPRDCCSLGPVHFTKPATGDPQWIDLVWIFYFEEGVVRPDEGQEYFDQWVRLAATAGGSSPGGLSTVVVKREAVQAHLWLSALALASAVTGTASLGIWVWRDRTPPPARADAAGLVDLAQAGQIYLRRMASLLLVLLLPLLAAGWALEGIVRDGMQGITGPSTAWTLPLQWGVRIVVAAVLVAWISQWLRIRKRLRAWKDDRPALDL